MKKILTKSIALVMTCVMLLCAAPMNIFAADSYTSDQDITLDTLNKTAAMLSSMADYLQSAKASLFTKKIVSDEEIKKIDDTAETLSDAVAYLSGTGTSAEKNISDSDVNALKEVAAIFEKIAFYLNSVDYTSLGGVILREILPDNSAQKFRKTAAALKAISAYFEENDLSDLKADIKNETSAETTVSRIKHVITFIANTLKSIPGVLLNGFDLKEDGIASYLYDPAEKCFYTASDPWQRSVGYGILYDVASPLVLINFDTVRLKFDYAGENWLIQVWKGQYGMVFYGGEIGVYTKPADRNVDIYDCADDDKLLKMSMDFYEYETGFLKKPVWEKKFSRPYGEYWWCTGFIPGNRLGEFENLRVSARITMKDYDMLKAFTDALSNQVISYKTNGLDVTFNY